MCCIGIQKTHGAKQNWRPSGNGKSMNVRARARARVRVDSESMTVNCIEYNGHRRGPNDKRSIVGLECCFGCCALQVCGLADKARWRRRCFWYVTHCAEHFMNSPNELIHDRISRARDESTHLLATTAPTIRSPNSNIFVDDADAKSPNRK